MTVSSGPTLLAVALAAEMHGRRSVGLAAAAFTVGSLAAPLLVSRLQARSWHQPTVWLWCAVGMVAGWVLAPLAVGFLCLAQLASGLCMTALEGLLDGHAAARAPTRSPPRWRRRRPAGRSGRPSARPRCRWSSPAPASGSEPR